MEVGPQCPKAYRARREYEAKRCSGAVLTYRPVFLSIITAAMPWRRAQRPNLFGKALASAKSALDPAGIVNPGVLAP